MALLSSKLAELGFYCGSTKLGYLLALYEYHSKWRLGGVFQQASPLNVFQRKWMKSEHIGLREASILVIPSIQTFYYINYFNPFFASCFCFSLYGYYLWNWRCVSLWFLCRVSSWLLWERYLFLSHILPSMLSYQRKGDIFSFVFFLWNRMFQLKFHKDEWIIRYFLLIHILVVYAWKLIFRSSTTTPTTKLLEQITCSRTNYLHNYSETMLNFT